MRYDVEVDWHLLSTCNYRCAYCFVPPEHLASKVQIFASPQAWQLAFDASGAVWLIHLTGGEPSIYPDFVELSRALTANHYISINSNLTRPSLLKFAEEIDPQRVSFINAGLHIGEREKRAGTDIFVWHADRLRLAGFRVLVSVVATPEALTRFEEAIALLKPVGLFPIPKLLRGLWSGGIYPHAYTSFDKDRFRIFSRRAREFYGREILARIADPPSLDMLNDDIYVDGVPDFRGLMCEAGHKFVHMRSNGDIFRCGGDFRGNLLVGSFARSLTPAPCKTSYCYYFCDKYSDQQQRNARLGAAQSIGHTYARG